MRFGEVVAAVDWSGRALGAESAIWRAVIGDGEIALEGGLGRQETVRALLDLARETERCTIGLDFSFSYPAWFLRSIGVTEVGDLWERVRRDGEEWLRSSPPPFFGRRGTRRPVDVELLRATERPAAFAGAFRPFSTFQTGGAGAVGTGAIRGMPLLPTFRSAGFAIWPFDAPAERTVVEIYPRMFTGPVVKRDRAARSERLDAVDLPPGIRRLAIESEDAFDALLAAIGLWERRGEIPLLEQATADPERCEGRIFGSARTTEETVAPRGVGATTSGPRAGSRA